MKKVSGYKPWERAGKKKPPLIPPASPPTGPTLNLRYNMLLVRLKETGADATPLCDGCDADLTGKAVHDTSVGWLCDECDKEVVVPTSAAPKRRKAS